MKSIILSNYSRKFWRILGGNRYKIVAILAKPSESHPLIVKTLGSLWCLLVYYFKNLDKTITIQSESRCSQGWLYYETHLCGVYKAYAVENKEYGVAATSIFPFYGFMCDSNPLIQSHVP